MGSSAMIIAKVLPCFTVGKEEGEEEGDEGRLSR